MGQSNEHEGVQPWARLPDEPGKMFHLFSIYLSTAPRSVRQAVAIAWHEEGREPALHVPGSVIRASIRWQWAARAQARDAWLADRERVAWEQTRAAARRRRIAQLDKMAALVDGRLSTLGEKDLRKVRADRALEVFLKVHAAEQAEFGDRVEDRRGEDRPDHGLPSIEDRIKPPSDHDHE